MYVATRSILLLFLVIALGCTEDPGPTAPSSESGPPSGARTLAIPPSNATPQPVPRQTGGPLVWTVPEDWDVESPSSNMRYAQYRVEGSGGAGSCLVFYFGPGQGGGAMANAERWAGQFTQPDGGSSSEAMTVTELTGAPLPTRIVEVTGTYEGGMTMTDEPAPRMPQYMLLGAIIEGRDAPWFFKFTGPESTVREQASAFEAMVRSVRAGG